MADEKPILIGSSADLDRLLSSNRMCPGLITTLDDAAIASRLDVDADNRSSAMLAITFETLGFCLDDQDKLSLYDREVRERFVATLVRRRMIVLMSVENRRAEEAMQLLGSLLSQVRGRGKQGFQPSDCVLILPLIGGGDDDDKMAIKKLCECPEVEEIGRCYVMSSRLNGSLDKVRVDSRYVWPEAVAGLLIHLTQVSNEDLCADNDSRWRAWRSVFVESDMSNSQIATDFYKHVEEWLDGDKKLFDVKSPSEPTFDESDPSGEPPDEKTRKPRFWDKQKPLFYQGYVKSRLASENLKATRDQFAKTTRVKSTEEIAKADQEVAQATTDHWLQAKKSPRHVSSMQRALPIKIRKVRMDIAELKKDAAAAYEELKLALDRIRIIREKLLRKAAIIDEARAHFVGSGTRLFFVFATSLLVVYLCFVLLEPVLGLLMKNWVFWTACSAGVAGAALAAMMSWIIEWRAGECGVDTLLADIAKAQAESPHSACVKYFARLNKCAVQTEYYLSLHNTDQLADRLGCTIEASTASCERGLAAGADEYQPGVASDPRIRRLDRKAYEQGSLVRVGCDAALSDEAKNMLEDDLKSGLEESWRAIAEVCDAKNLGSYPIAVVSGGWKRGVQGALAQYYASRFDMVKDDKSLLGESNLAAFTVLHGGVEEPLPFMSVGGVGSLARDSTRLMYCAHEKSASDFAAAVQKSQDVLPVPKAFDPKLPILGLFHQEVDIDTFLDDLSGADAL